LEGFERFLLPKTISELSAAAQEGPIIILNIANDKCDALALIPGLHDEVMHIPLNDFKPESAGSMTQSFGNLVGRSERLVMKREGQMNPEDEFAHNLSQLWKKVVKPVLDALAITVSHTYLVLLIFTTYYRHQEKQTFLVSGGVRQALLLFSQSMLQACMERTMPLAQNCPIL
jgi:hypothetical protein